MSSNAKYLTTFLIIVASIYLLNIRDVFGLTHARNQNLADTFFQQEDYITSKNYYTEALSTRKQCKHCLSRLAICKSKIDNDDQSEDHLIDKMQIGSTSVGSIKLFMKPEEILSIAHKNNYKAKTYEWCQECDAPVDIIIDTKNGDNIIGASYGFIEENRIHTISLKSNMHKTINGIYVGMPIEGYLELYPKAYLYKVENAPHQPPEKEYFLPTDFQTDSTHFKVLVSSSNPNHELCDWLGIQKKSQKVISFQHKSMTKEYSKNGYVSTIEIGYSNEYYEALYELKEK